MHCLFLLQIPQGNWSSDDKHLFMQMTTVCSKAVANSSKVPSLRLILSMHVTDFASVELYTHLDCTVSSESAKCNKL